MKRIFILLVSLLAMMAANLSVTAQETATAKASMGNNVNRSQSSFITNGNWNDGSHWDTGTVPPSGSDVVIMADAIIPAGYTAVVNEVSINGGSITVADGGQLRHNTEGLVVTMKKNIEPYEDVNGTGNYYLLAFPFNVDVAVPNAMTANEGCDFYKFDGDFLGAEWRNNKQETIDTVSGTTGYLYANSEAIELSLTGSTYPSYNEEVIPVTVPYIEGSTNPYNGWALLGNPFTCNAYIYCHNSDDELVPMEFMVYDATGELMTLSDEPIAPMQGFFVKVTETTTVYILNYADHSSHEYVDLGLPSGLLWATCNVGADTPEGYGDYFAWGETQTKSTYNYYTYQYCNGSSSTLTKYCNNSNYGYNGYTDTLTILLPEDDAAMANWGSDWRMPTKEEWEELYNNTTCTLTTQNGVRGRLFTASNGNSLFLPSAGHHANNSLDNAGSFGYYWSSSLNTDNPRNAWYFYSGSNVYNYYVNPFRRDYGLPVRAVRSAPLASYVINATAYPEEGGIVIGSGTYAEGAECTLTATPNEGYAFTHWTEDGEVVSTDATYSFTVTGDRNLVANFDPYVDLGLPSGTLWATCNVGAETPEDYGDYFAWGETQPKDTYDWSTYQYCMGSNNTLTKYCTNAGYGYNGFTDNLTTLQPEDDAATANWSSDWCMPTQAQWQELLDNTTVTWTTQNGVNGRLFTASNGNTLFLPAAGYRDDSSLHYAGSYGYYWSSSLYTGGPNIAWYFYFNSVDCGMYGTNRSYGQSVRAVRVQSYTINVSVSPSDGGNASGGGSYEQGQSCTLTATPNEGYVFTNWTEDGEVVSTDATYSFTVTGDRNLVANFDHGYVDHPYVDLGLPSGLLWATCNVGAETPEDYGDYFAWGETQPKETYSWSTYQYCNGSYNTLTKYCNNDWCGYNGFTDNLTTLLPEDDAATANWGNGWRMPTKEEFQELYNNTTVTWTTQNGVNGRLFTASNGNILFLPAAGWRYNSSLDYSGSQGNYWSSSLDTGNPNYAWLLYFHSGEYFVNIGNRYYGHSVRAVRSVPLASYVINATVYPEEGGIVIGSGTYDEGAECTLTATPNEGYVFTHWTEDGEVVSTDATYSFTVTGDRNLVANFDHAYVGHAYVDLGLPSGTLWATYNVGANSPEEYGDYFAWGETQPKDIYDWNTYQYCNGDYNLLTKYCNNSSFGYNGFTDTLTTLLPEDDAATANWGANWRMPTEEEWQELYQNTTHTWTTQNGVRGRLFTASNGNSLFLPAAGYRIDSSLDYAGSQGYYWSSSLYTDYPGDAWYFYFDSDIYGMYRNIRRCGRSVRAVRSGLQN